MASKRHPDHGRDVAVMHRSDTQTLMCVPAEKCYDQVVSHLSHKPPLLKEIDSPWDKDPDKTDAKSIII